MDTYECSFYFDYQHTNSSPSDDQELILLFDKYFTKYVVGKEISKSGVKHLQCWALGSTKSSYTNFIQKIVKLLNLIGRATKGKRKQYGRIKGVIKDTDNMISYCLKENRGYWSKGLETEYLEERLASSFTHEVTPKEKFAQFILDARDAIYHTIEPDSFEHPHMTHQRLLEQCTIISQVYEKTYENIIPKTAVDKTLLALGLIDHKRIAQNRFFAYVGAPQDCLTYLETNEIMEL